MTDYDGTCWDCWYFCSDDSWCFYHEKIITGSDLVNATCSSGIYYEEKLLEMKVENENFKMV